MSYAKAPEPKRKVGSALRYQLAVKARTAGARIARIHAYVSLLLPRFLISQAAQGAHLFDHVRSKDEHVRILCKALRRGEVADVFEMIPWRSHDLEHVERCVRSWMSKHLELCRGKRKTDRQAGGSSALAQIKDAGLRGRESDWQSLV